MDLSLPDHIALTESGKLFLVGGRHQVLKRFAARGEGCPDRNLRAFLGNLEERRLYCESRGIGFSQWVFPDPIVFRGVLPPGEVESVFLKSVPSESRCQYLLYPLDVLDGCEERQSKTDTHYSPLGRLYLAARVAEVATGFSEPEELVRLESAAVWVDGFAGDLGSKCSPPITERRLVPPRLRGVKNATNGIKGGNNGVIHLVDSPEARLNRKLLIFGDSFFRSMLPELARYWRHVVFFRTRFFHYEMVEAIAPDDIVCGMAERYFPSTVPDDERPHFLAYPLIAGRAVVPDEGFADLWSSMVDQSALALASVEPAGGKLR